MGLNTNNPTLPQFQSSSDPSAIGVSGGISVPSYYQSYLTQQQHYNMLMHFNIQNHDNQLQIKKQKLDQAW